MQIRAVTHCLPNYASHECALEVRAATAQEEVCQALQIDLLTIILVDFNLSLVYLLLLLFSGGC